MLIAAGRPSAIAVAPNLPVSALWRGHNRAVPASPSAALGTQEQNMLTREELEQTVESVLEQEVNRIFATVPYAGHLIEDSEYFNEAYYLRHRIETVKRIRLTSKTDALALVRMLEEEYDAARWWSRYITEELDHDLLYLKDLSQHGYSEDRVFAVPPFSATLAMIDYLSESIARTGSLPAVAYAIWTEWNSERVSSRVAERAQRQYSDAHVAGSRAHAGIDEDEDHYSMMLDVAHRLVLKQGTESALVELLRDISSFVSDYLRQLYEETVAQRQVEQSEAQ
jgi:hypothetical protein